MTAQRLARVAETGRGVWFVFQTIGFAGLIFGKDRGSHALVWRCLTIIGFSVGVCGAVVYFVLLVHLRRRSDGPHERDPRVDETEPP